MWADQQGRGGREARSEMLRAVFAAPERTLLGRAMARLPRTAGQGQCCPRSLPPIAHGWSVGLHYSA